MIKFLVSALAVFCLANGIALITVAGSVQQKAIAVAFTLAGAILFEARFKLHDRG